jgi:hypothetical protein
MRIRHAPMCMRASKSSRKYHVADGNSASKRLPRSSRVSASARSEARYVGEPLHHLAITPPAALDFRVPDPVRQTSPSQASRKHYFNRSYRSRRTPL